MKTRKLFLLLFVVSFGFIPETNGQITTYGTGAGTGGDHNSFYGVNAGQNTVLGGASPNFGKYNIFIGEDAARYSTSGFSNVFAGYLVGQNFNSGGNNVFLGTSAGTNSTSNRSIHIGTETGRVSAGDDNVFLGHQSGYNNTTGNQNTFLGIYAGYYNTTGYSNIFIGKDSGQKNTSGSENIFLGRGSGYFNSTGTTNIFIGTSAGGYATTGSHNTSIGHGAGNVCNGTMNTFIGESSGVSVTNADNNVFLGYQSGNASTTGGSNTFLGRSAGASNVTGSYNTFVGNAAGAQNAGGNDNTYLGFNAGWGNDNGVGNVFVGNKAGFNGSGPTMSNKLIISNHDDTATSLVFGDFNTRFVDINGSVGVNLLSNATPGNRIEIRHGTTGNSGLRFTNLDSTSTPVSPNGRVLTVNSTGDVVLTTDQGSSGSTVVTGTGIVSVTGIGTSGNPYVVNAQHTHNIFDCDGTLDDTTPHTGTPGMRRVSMYESNLWFDSSSSSWDKGRIYIGNDFLLSPIGTDFKLYVEGGILTERVKVALRNPAVNWADYVFGEDYKPMPLKEVEAFVKQNKHLPGIESAEDLVKNGLDLAEMQAKQMGKIEELTLYAIEQNKMLEKQSKEIEELKAQVKKLLEKTN